MLNALETRNVPSKNEAVKVGKVCRMGGEVSLAKEWYGSIWPRLGVIHHALK